MTSPGRTSTEQTFISNLACQRCSIPLNLAFSFKNIDDEIFDELSNPAYLNPDQDDRKALLRIFHKKCESSAMRKIMVPVNIGDTSSDFMVVGELASLPLDCTQSLKYTDALLNLTSDQSTLNHPLCEECTDCILEKMDSQFVVAKNESEMYQEFLNKLEMENASAADDKEIKELEAQLKKLKNEEAILEAELHELESKQKSTKEKLAEIEERTEKLDKEEKQEWNKYFIVKHRVLLAEDNERSVNNQIMYSQAQLNKLTNTNIFSATFHIWYRGHFGTINNFRLGRLRDEPVEWLEINAAWGQTVLLLHSLATKINLTFERYRLVPYGSHSYIVPLNSKIKHLPLYCFGGSNYVVHNRLRFDDAMVAFLDCLRQFKEKVESGDDSFHLPYRMSKGKIEDMQARKSYSIKIDLNSEEQWTKALKFMLTNLRWALAWVSTQFQDTTH